MSRINLFVSLLVVVLSLNCFASIIDDFEDGDTTNNPQWHIASNAGNDAVVPDPIRAGNLAYRAQGTPTNTRTIYSFLDNETSLNGLDFGYDFMLSAQDYHLDVALRGDSGSTSVVSRMQYRSGWSNVSLSLEQGGVAANSVLAPDDIPTNSWMRMHIWHDTVEGMLNQEIRLIDTDELILAISTPAVSGLITANANRVVMDIERTSWQYVDNITLVPEPATMLLFGLGGMLLRKRKA